VPLKTNTVLLATTPLAGVRKNTRCNGYGQEEAKKRFSGSLYSVKAHTHMMPARKLCLVTTRQRERERERERERNKQTKKGFDSG
jgi:hypothetical protein